MTGELVAKDAIISVTVNSGGRTIDRTYHSKHGRLKEVGGKTSMAAKLKSITRAGFEADLLGIRLQQPTLHDEHVQDFLSDLDETFYAVYGSWAISEMGGDLEPDFNTDAFIASFTREEKQKILEDMGHSI